MRLDHSHLHVPLGRGFAVFGLAVRSYANTIYGIALTLLIVPISLAGTIKSPWDAQWEKARSFEAAGSWSIAEQAYKRTIEIARASHADQYIVRDLEIKLATVFVRENKFNDARPIYQELMDSDVVNPANRHSKEAREGIVSFADLADTYAMSHDNREDCLKHALAIMQKLFGANDDRLIGILNDLFLYYNLQQKYKEAEPVLKQRVAILQSSRAAAKTLPGVIGENPGELARTLTELGGVQIVLKKYADAQFSYAQAYPIFLKEDGPTYPMTASIARGLGFLMLKQHHTQQAMEWSQRAVELRRKGQAQYPIETARDLFVLGRVFEQEDNLPKAEQYYRQTITVIEGSSGRYSAELICPMEYLTRIMKRAGKTLEAKGVDQRLSLLRQRVKPGTISLMAIEGQ